MINTPSSTVDYVVYTFDKIGQYGKDGAAAWKRHSIFDDKENAINTAKELFNSQKYTRIEIKKRFFAPRKNRQIYAVIKILKPSYFAPHGALHNTYTKIMMFLSGSMTKNESPFKA